MNQNKIPLEAKIHLNRFKPRETNFDSQMLQFKFGNWLVLEVAPKRHTKEKRYYICKCDCGTKKRVSGYHLRNKRTLCCSDCRNKKLREQTGSLNSSFKHGFAKKNKPSSTYKIWVGILTRCYNSKVKIYKYYGGRGITLCDEWRDFTNFHTDMGDRPEGLQLDRIDNSKGYFKDNCRWVTARENNPYIKGDVPDNMPGKRFGKWVIVARVIHKPNHWYYLCRCDCGYEGIRAGGELRKGRSTQCRNCKNISHRGWHARKKIAEL